MLVILYISVNFVLESLNMPLRKVIYISYRTVLFSLTSVVVLVITTDWISWDKLNRGFLPSDEVSRAFLASFILVFDLLIVMQVCWYKCFVVPVFKVCT